MKGLSGHGKAILELYKVTKLRIINSRFFKNKNIRKSTCHESKGASVFDYLLTDYNIWNTSTNFEMHDISDLSDHCAIEFSINA